MNEEIKRLRKHIIGLEKEMIVMEETMNKLEENRFAIIKHQIGLAKKGILDDIFTNSSFIEHLNLAQQKELKEMILK